MKRSRRQSRLARRNPTEGMTAEQRLHWKILHRHKEGVEADIDETINRPPIPNPCPDSKGKGVASLPSPSEGVGGGSNAAYLEERSRNWRNLFDPSTGFIRPKGARRLVARAVRSLVARGLRRGQRVAGDLVHLARRDGAGEPDGRRGGLRRQAQLRVRARRGRRTSSPTTATATSATATSRGCRWRTSSTTSATRG